MERRIERIKHSTEEELLGYIRKGRTDGIEAAKEISRREEPISKETLISILLNLKPKGVDQEKEIAKLKEKSLEKLIADFRLKEDDLLVILEEGESPVLIDKALDKYSLENEKRSNLLLRTIIRNVKVSKEKKERAGRLLFKQTESRRDWLAMEEELEGELQFKAWKRHRQKGISIEDSVWITGFVPTLAETNWEKDKEEGIIRKLSIDDLYDIARYTDALKVKKGALNFMWLKKEDLDKGQLEYLKDNADLITIEDPEKVREWIDNRFFYFPLELEEVIHLKEKAQLPSGKLKMAKKALEIVEWEIKEKGREKEESPSFYNRWDEDQLNKLKKQKSELKEEILSLQEQVQGPVKEKGGKIEISVALKT